MGYKDSGTGSTVLRYCTNAEQQPNWQSNATKNSLHHFRKACKVQHVLRSLLSWFRLRGFWFWINLPLTLTGWMLNMSVMDWRGCVQPFCTNSLVNANLFQAYFTNMTFQNISILHLTHALLYKVPSKSTGKNFVTNVYCFYLQNL